MSLTCFDHLGSVFPLAYPSIDVTGALVPHSPKCMVVGLGFLCTCVSVRRRDRCTRTFLIRFFGSALSCYVHAPLPYLLFQFALRLHFGSAHYALHNFGLCCPLSLWWSCGSLDLLPCGARGISLCLAPVCASPGLPGSVALLAVRELALLALLLFALFCFWLLSLSVLLSLPPRVVWFGALVQRGTWFAGTSLWVSGCSCDGLVALLSCWECG